ncbi:MAG: DUF1294 domain-containing protein [Prosthecobacter sp.]
MKAAPGRAPTPVPERTARLLSWDAGKGYGWLDWAGKQVFLHARDYAGTRHGPAKGEEIRFVLGVDPQGRPCAKWARPVNAPMSVGSWFHAALWLASLALPAYALHQQRVNPALASAVALFISVVTYLAYVNDKRRALAGDWRMTEASLHLLELLGGWPGAWIAQRRLRHKCSKLSYQGTFWAIILIHQFIALDSLQNWQFGRPLIAYIVKLLGGYGMKLN